MKFRIRKCKAHSQHRDGIDRNHKTWFEVDQKNWIFWHKIYHYACGYRMDVVKYPDLASAEAYIERKLAEPISGFRECEVVKEF